MAPRSYGVFIVFLLKLTTGECFDSNEESAPKEVLGDEYEQIFNSIPTLFEYLLEILEERPEILEKDDVTFFKEVPQDACEVVDKRKREVNIQCDDNMACEYNLEAFEGNIVTKYVGNAKDTKIDENNSLVDVTKVLDDNSEVIRDAISFRASKVNKVKAKSKANKSDENSGMKGKKRNVDREESFLGPVNSIEFNLDPKDVEEQVLKTVIAIEEHNKNKGR